MRDRLKKCVKCGDLVHQGAQICPGCGRRGPHVTDIQKYLQNGLFILIGLGVLAWCWVTLAKSLQSPQGSALGNEGKNILRHVVPARSQ